MIDHVAKLEAALLEQAETQAREMRHQADQRRKHILAEGRAQLVEREAAEKSAAEAGADTVYRQAIQAHALRLNLELQQLRWNLVQELVDDLWSQLEALTADDDTYLPLLRRFLGHAAALIDGDQLVVEVNERDRVRLAAVWDDFSQPAAGKQATLSPNPVDARGGLIVRDPGNRVRVDERFEARVERLQGRLHQTLLAELLPT